MSGKEAVKRWRDLIDETAFIHAKYGGDVDAIYSEWMPRGWQRAARQMGKEGLLDEVPFHFGPDKEKRAKAILETAFPQDGE